VKFIVDAQLPKSLSDFFNRKGHDSIHTLELPDKNQTKDNFIKKLSIIEERVVVTKDIDFLESFLIKFEPKKLILIKTGNIHNTQLLKIFSSNFELIIKMIERSNLVEISKTDIAEHS
jgi:predicted nuclease of predicted toxin-antitoxin system